ncbi:hypothetical protein M406DRAFT_293095 [Cryphonectria parasitica EP155]|uniref:Rhodopsin domain-containing protein n=1 Tax=Cryphonectria parasitica (strain ATCC 38755 / EP155) TaxID=660469 RepID=A0A9P5CLT9_CRYP1|nr:uncharacterized protein M406DRAFT_293095 [Cryphonectria parasitica EP155]KAF3763428.1 hypothetical protein M406DRAFT_293095 [Cryphonectria parasitica EP155]
MVEPAGVGVPLLRVTILFLVLTWVTVIVRVSVRRWLRPEAKGLDDLMMCIGLVLYTVTCSLVIVCCYHGAGQLSEHLTAIDIMQGTKVFFIAEFFYAGCTVPIKSSICVCLIRVADGRRRFSWTLWGLVALQFMAAIIFFAGISNICHPITTLWGETTYGTCDSKLNSSVSFLFSAVSILTDVTLAILPAILIWPIQMKRRLKVSVAIILGMAAFASCATIIRLRYLTLYDNQAEFMYSAGPIGLWSVVEEGISIVAGSLPALRPLLSLPMFGGTRDASKGISNPETDLQTWGAGDKRDVADDLTDSMKMQTFVISKDGDSDGESQTHILKETHVMVSTEHINSTGTEEWTKRRVNGWDRAADK